MKKILFFIWMSISSTFAFCQGQVSVGELGGPPLPAPPATMTPSTFSSGPPTQTLDEGLTGINFSARGLARTPDHRVVANPRNYVKKRVDPFTGYNEAGTEDDSGSARARLDYSLGIRHTPTGFFFNLMLTSRVMVSGFSDRTSCTSDFWADCYIFMYFRDNVHIVMEPRIVAHSGGATPIGQSGRNIGSIKLYKYSMEAYSSVIGPGSLRDTIGPSPFELDLVYPGFSGTEILSPGMIDRELGPGLYAIAVSVRSQAFTQVRNSNREHRTISSIYFEVYDNL